MKQPVFLYYGLDNFYQNHRLYISSFNAAQLRGEDVEFEDVNKTCWPAVTNANLGVNQSWNGVDLDPNAVASPCGLVAKSWFSGKFLRCIGAYLYIDKYVMTDESGNDISIQQNDIAWPNEAGSKYKKSANSANTQWIDPEDGEIMHI